MGRWVSGWVTGWVSEWAGRWVCVWLGCVGCPNISINSGNEVVMGKPSYEVFVAVGRGRSKCLKVKVPPQDVFFCCPWH